ncbi:MAG: helix-turn-helix domain-containing protein [Alphaproteobacteria bacterium]
MSNALGDKIRQLRKHHGLTLDELAKRADSSKGYIWELENRDTRNPSADKLMKIAEALETTADFLLDKTKSEPDADDMQAALYRNFEKLDKEDKERFMKMVKDWSKS